MIKPIGSHIISAIDINQNYDTEKSCNDSLTLTINDALSSINSNGILNAVD